MVANEIFYIDQFRNRLNTYAPVATDTFDKLRPILRLRPVAKGEFMVRAGQTATDFHFVCEGIVASLIVNREGNTHIKNFFTPGNFAGSKASLLRSSPSSFSLQVLDAGVIISFDYKKIKRLIYDHEDLKNFYIAYLEENWVIDNEKRQLAFATQTAKERYLTFLETYPGLDKRVSQHHIASYLGVTPTQLSRIRKIVYQK
ncbi:Crp/Fnr family transcriptional regulator [Fibrella aquatilis]|uniref:Crp/Fnr family transcriptional regulator n=1 Tax=Fibrella aquatilis TaxID=2817059 RepID=A0A939G7T5_9BACT|nr:Crp/Fnr family transcriptional regulator [Fibrella aquatilis]MBO0931965.1 Crp/Fnr family transcriptional regulator [Fibrella aquatilis]